MSDGGSSGFKQFSGEMGQAAKEVVKDTGETLQDTGQQAAESLTGSYQDPLKQQAQQNQQQSPQLQQQVQAQSNPQKQQEEQKRLSWARAIINRFKKTDQDVAKVRDQKQQAWMQRKQEEQQQSEKEKAEEERRRQTIPSPAKSRTGPGMPGGKPMSEDIARSQAELRAGRGSGG